MVKGVRKAVIPVAGLGTRFLPATKAVPKPMLPVIDKPALQYVVEEASAAGLDDVLLVTSRGQESIGDHFDVAPPLEEALERKGKDEELAAVRRPAELATMHTVRQDVQRGLGHAILCAAHHVGDEPFACLLGDDLIDPRDPLLTTMLEVHARHGGHVVCLIDVGRENISKYGATSVEPTGVPDVMSVYDLVEKPPADEAPSTLAVIGRYVFDPVIFDAIRRTPPGRGDEIQITDAIRIAAQDGVPVHGVVFHGRRYDTGNPADYLQAVVRLAVDRPDLGPEFREWLVDFVSGLG
jgi:UTP--glucose-1-phosphate uridylyltransferase